jgi:hypothetical protein
MGLAMNPPRWNHFRSGAIAIPIGAAILAILIVVDRGELLLSLLRKLYHPFAAFVAVVMLVEYVILKGADRSAIYRRELEAARLKRREDLLMLRRLEGRLVELESELRGREAGAEANELARRAHGEIQAMLELIRSHV